MLILILGSLLRLTQILKKFFFLAFFSVHVIQLSAQIKDSVTKYALSEVVYSGSRFIEKRTDVPRQIQIIDAQQMELASQPSVPDLLQQSGKLFVQKSQLGGGSPVIRGFEANKILLVVDGIRINNAIYRGGHLQNSLTIDQSMLERIEIVQGPGAVLYGSDALGGVLHFRTKNPLFADSISSLCTKLNAYTRVGTAAFERTAHVDFNLGNRKWASLSSITYSHFNDVRQGANHYADWGNWGKRSFYVERIGDKDSMLRNTNENIQKFSGYQQVDVLQKVLFKPNRFQQHGLNLQWSTSSDIPRYDRLTEIDSKGLARSAEWYYGPQKRFLAAYHFEHLKTTKFYDHLQWTFAFQQVEESRINRNFRNPLRNHRIENVQVASVNLDFSKKTKWFEWRYGADYQGNWVHSEAYKQHIVLGTKSGLDTRYPDGGSQMHFLATFLQTCIELSDRWVLTAGVRFSKVQLQATFNDQTFFPFPYNRIVQNHSAFNGHIGVSFKPKSMVQLYGQLSSGYRAPNVDDLAKVFESNQNQLLIPNPQIKPEYTYTGEIGCHTRIRKSWHLESAIWYTYYFNALNTKLLDRQIMYANRIVPLIQIDNVQKAFLYGFSKTIAWQPYPKWRIESGLNYTYGRILTDSTLYPLDHIPPMYGKTSIQYNTKKTIATVFVLYQGDKKLKDYNLLGEDNVVYALSGFGTPAWMTAHLMIWHKLNQHFSIQLAVDNIFDRYYRVFASGISGAGRNAHITVRYQF